MMTPVDKHLALDRAVLTLRHLELLDDATEDYFIELRERLWSAMSAAERSTLEQRWLAELQNFRASGLGAPHTTEVSGE